jgi:hypothetical protein
MPTYLVPSISILEQIHIPFSTRKYGENVWVVVFIPPQKIGVIPLLTVFFLLSNPFLEYLRHGWKFLATARAIAGVVNHCFQLT